MRGYRLKKLNRARRTTRRLFQGASAWLASPFRLVQNLCQSLGRTLRFWWRKRKLPQLLRGLPALVVACSAAYIGAAARNQSVAQISSQYQLAADAAMTTQDFTSAKVYLERLIQLHPGSRETLFDIARAAEHTKDYPRMASAMRQLAPDDHPVHGPSHLWQATRLLAHKPMSQAEIRLAETHLLHALALHESTAVAHDLLGQMYFQLGLWSQAIPHLDASPDRSRRLMLAKAYALAGEGEKGRSAAEQAREYFSRAAAAHPQDFKIRLNWAEAHLFLEQYSEAIRVLRDAQTIDDQPSIRRALARSYVAWADSLNDANPLHRRQKFDLLAAGVNAYPDEFTLYDRILKLLTFEDEASEAARQFLQTNIVEGHAVGLSHLILGAYSFTSGRNEEARLHMERALESLPNADLVANNLAWLMIHSDPAQPERALSLIDPVVQRNPSMARFLDTRGHVLLKLNRTKDAVRDLELAVAELPKNVSTHDALANAYSQMGLADLAAMHLALSHKLKQSENNR